MPALTVIMSCKRPNNGPANLIPVWLKNFFVKLYVEHDKAQRKKAGDIIRRYGHLISDCDENCGEQKKTIRSKKSDYKSLQFGPVNARNRNRRNSKP